MYSKGQYSIVFVNPAIAPQMLASWTGFDKYRNQAKNVIITPPFAQFQLVPDLQVNILEGKIELLWKQINKENASQKLLPIAEDFLRTYEHNRMKAIGINSLGTVSDDSAVWKSKLLDEQSVNEIASQGNVNLVDSEVKLAFGTEKGIIYIRFTKAKQGSQIDINYHIEKYNSNEEILDIFHNSIKYWEIGERVASLCIK